MIREATPTDFETLRTIERAAGEMFRSIGMGEIADDQPASDPELLPFVESGTAWVETDSEDRPIAYLLLEQLDVLEQFDGLEQLDALEQFDGLEQFDRPAHIQQVTVHPAHARRGIGAALIDTADRWAHQQRLSGLTLTTFAEVPWNAPYYSRLGFKILPEEEWTTGLRQRFVREAEAGLDAWQRVIMLREHRQRMSTGNP